MNIECDETVLSRDAVQVLCEKVGNSMDLPSGAVEALIIADANGFGPAIERVQRQYGYAVSYTNDAQYQAVGKTVARKMPDGSVTNSIILRQELLQSVFNELLKKTPLSDWDIWGQLGWYILQHEFGHALDNCLRQDTAETPVVLSSLAAIRDHYAGVLLSEFGASVHSGHAMTSSVYDFETSSTSETILKNFDLIEVETQSYLAGKITLWRLSAEVAQAFWLVLVQYSKINGSRIANPELKQKPISFWPSINSPSLQAMNRFQLSLESLWSCYPNWNAGLNNGLFDSWDELCLANNFRFTIWPTGQEAFHFASR